MTTQTNDIHYYDQKTEWIRTQVSEILTKWGLLPRFNRWRLTQDPSSGMIVLFGILNNRYIATHSSIPFSDYFDPRLLHDLANELQMEVVSCNSEGLRYAFILDRGSIVRLPTHIDYPFQDGEKVFVRVVVEDKPAPAMLTPTTPPVLPIKVDVINDQTLVDQGVAALLKVFDDLQTKGRTDVDLPRQDLPDVIKINEEEFIKQVAAHKVIWQRNHPL